MASDRQIRELVDNAHLVQSAQVGWTDEEQVFDLMIRMPLLEPELFSQLSLDQVVRILVATGITSAERVLRALGERLAFAVEFRRDHVMPVWVGEPK